MIRKGSVKAGRNSLNSLVMILIGTCLLGGRLAEPEPGRSMVYSMSVAFPKTITSGKSFSCTNSLVSISTTLIALSRTTPDDKARNSSCVL